jgi:hypothetical protein
MGEISTFTGKPTGLARNRRQVLRDEAAIYAMVHPRAMHAIEVDKAASWTRAARNTESFRETGKALAHEALLLAVGIRRLMWRRLP